jgi:uncharacterized protein (TIGR02996 family)
MSRTELDPIEAGLRQAINDNPHDDSCPLMLADWLDEHGRHEEAALCRQPTPPLGPEDSFEAVWEYHRQLVAYRWPPLLKPSKLRLTKHTVWSVASVLREPHSHRFSESGLIWADVRYGFIHALSLRWGQFLKYAPDLFRLNPISEVLVINFESPGDFLRRPVDDRERGRDRGQSPDRDQIISYDRCWYSWGRGAPRLRGRGELVGTIPAPLWDRLEGWESAVGAGEYGLSTPQRCYPDPVAAKLALSAAVVKYGRELALSMTHGSCGR